MSPMSAVHRKRGGARPGPSGSRRCMRSVLDAPAIPPGSATRRRAASSWSARQPRRGRAPGELGERLDRGLDAAGAGDATAVDQQRNVVSQPTWLRRSSTSAVPSNWLGAC